MAENDPPVSAPLVSASVLSKEERRNLLAQLERQSRKTEPPEITVQRVEQALTAGNLELARRVIDHLEKTAPQQPGIDLLRDRLAQAEREQKRRANLRTAEEMLVGYIQQRKKQMAQMALETLLEIAPDHPRRADYTVWVSDLDKEVELQKRVEEQLRAGRAALRAGDFDDAKRRLDTLRKVDPNAAATGQLAGEIEQAEQGIAHRADVERAKQRFEELLQTGAVEEAARLIDGLSRLDLPKVTLDFLRKRLADTHAKVRDEAEKQAARIRFQRHLESRDWQAARDLAQRFGERFPEGDEAARMFSEVNRREGDERRQQSLEQGVATLEKFIAAGKRKEAELVLKVLRGLDVDAAQLARYEARVLAL